MTTATTASTERPMDNTTAILENLFSDLGTYRVITQVPVTPAMARRIIALNSANNRNYKPSTGERYARDMTPDPVTGQRRWREKTGQTIVIGTDGQMIAGNHRMHAVAKSGQTIKFDLCFGAPPENISVIDTHTPHTGADILRISGAPDLTGVAPIVRWAWAWDHGAYMGTTGKVTPTPIEMLDRYNQEPHLFVAAAARGRDAARRSLAASSAVGMAFMLITHTNLDTHPTAAITHDFFDALISGSHIEEGQAVYELRERLRMRAKDRLRPAHQLALIIRGWNFYNRFTPDGNRVTVQRFTIAKEGKLGNANFPKPRRASDGPSPADSGPIDD